MCPLCIATGTLVLSGAGSASGLTAVVAKVLSRRRRMRQALQETQKANAGSVAQPGIVPAKAA